MAGTTTTGVPTAASALESCRQRADRIIGLLGPICPPEEDRAEEPEPQGLLAGVSGLDSDLARIEEMAARIRDRLGSSL